MITGLTNYITAIEQYNPGVLKTMVKADSIEINIYRPLGLKIDLAFSRPVINDSIYFCIPAAFTAKDTSIDGLYVYKGQVIDTPFNEKLTGACILKENNIQVLLQDELDDIIFQEIVKNKFSFFQQAVLIRNSQIVPCTLFKQKKNLRRALVILDNYYCVAESVLPVSISSFQDALLKIGVLDAIYLDMGTWSEGWYRDNDCTIRKIGEKFFNTHLQTNWLIYRL